MADDIEVIEGLQTIYIYEDEDSDRPLSEAPSTSDDEDHLLQVKKSGDIPPEYWHIQKLLKYVKAGNPTATVVALSCMLDYNLGTDMCQLAITDAGGLEVLLNILETTDIQSQLGALQILSIISDNVHIKRTLTDLGGAALFVKILQHPAKDLQILAAETLAHLSKIKTARKKVRNCGGIPQLVDLLDISDRCMNTAREQLSQNDNNLVSLARAGSRALWSLSASPRNKEEMRKAGIVPLLAKLIKSVHLDVVKSSMGTLQGCASEISYQLAIRTEGMVPDIVKYLSSEDRELQMHCASCLFKCSADEATRILIRKAGGLEPLVAIIKDSKLRENKQLLAATSGALWKCAGNDDNIKRLNTLGTVSALSTLLTEENEEVLTNVAGALSEMLRFKENVDTLRIEKGIPHLVNLLTRVDEKLLENVPLALAQCAMQPDAMAIIEEMDGVRLIWTLLKNPSDKVKANASWALRPCIENATDSGEMVRSFVGCLELVVSLLESKDTRVLSGVCAAIAVIASDLENLAVMTDHGVVGKLARLVSTTDPNLREYLADAIGNCCCWSNNRILFGKLGAITPLVAYMAAADQPRVHKTTALALCRLSEDPFNCITMHQSGVVPFLLETVSSEDTALQDSSAGCLCNIRRLALAAEKFKLKL